MTDEESVKPASKRREATRARLLDAAHEVFAAMGMGAASVEEISERAGFTRGAFYSNFESKEDLFLALVRRLADTKLDHVTDHMRSVTPDADRATDELVDQLISMSIGSRIDPLLMSEIRTQALRDERLGAAYREWHAQLLGRVTALIEDLVRTHHVPLRVSAARAARILSSVVEDAATEATLERWSPEEASRYIDAEVQAAALAIIDR